MSLNRWVSDELHHILGYSDATTVQYMIALAKKSIDPDDYLERLSKSDYTVNSAIRNFAAELFEKVPHAGNLNSLFI